MKRTSSVLLFSLALQGCGEVSVLERELGYAEGHADGYAIACGEEDMVPDHGRQKNEAFLAGYQEGLKAGKAECEKSLSQ